MDLYSPIEELEGIGPKRAEILKIHGIHTVQDLLFYLPRKYLDRSTFHKIRDCRPDEQANVIGCVTSVQIIRRGRPRFKLFVEDETGKIGALWFGRVGPYRYIFKKGDLIVLCGKISVYKEKQFIHPEYEILDEEASQDDLIHTGKIIPLYPLTEELREAQLTHRFFRRILKNLFSILDPLEEIFPPPFLQKHRFHSLETSLREIHYPQTMESASAAKKRLIHLELFLISFLVSQNKARQRAIIKPNQHQLKGNLRDQFIQRLPYSLTKAQERVLQEIWQEMCRPYPMNRLLQGDVGTGKTLVAILALLLSVENGSQAVLMAPTEILARQHMNTLKQWLDPLGVPLVCLLGSEKKGEPEVLEQIKSGVIQVIVGTHVILQERVQFFRVGLVIIDEQHKFGVNQRRILSQKVGYPVDKLMMTATPIPRTLALTLYGDLDLSIIDESPKNRGTVITALRSPKARASIYTFVKEQIEQGYRAYIICPAIRLSRNGVLAVEQHFSELKNGVLKDFPMELIHGEINPSKQDEIFRLFKEGRIPLIVATTIIEVGIDVPEASVMVIENAEQFGLAQLHQLRGRIGRGPQKGYCILICGKTTETEALQRIEQFCSTTDGFQIAEIDLAARGPGEFFGEKQSGLPALRFADLLKDLQLIESCKKDLEDFQQQFSINSSFWNKIEYWAKHFWIEDEMMGIG